MHNMYVTGKNTIFGSTFNREIGSPTVGLIAEWNESSILVPYPDNLSIVY